MLRQGPDSFWGLVPEAILAIPAAVVSGARCPAGLRVRNSSRHRDCGLLGSCALLNLSNSMVELLHLEQQLSQHFATCI